MRVVAECEVNTRASVAATDDSDVFRLDLQSERIGHDYIEAEEPEAAGIADQECLHATYSLRDARFRKDKASSNELERCWIPVHPKPEQRR